MTVPVALQWADSIIAIANEALDLTQSGFAEVTPLNNIVRSVGYNREKILKHMRSSVLEEKELRDLERRAKYYLDLLQQRQQERRKQPRK